MFFILNPNVLKQAENCQLFSEPSNTNDGNCCPDDMSSQDKDKNIYFNVPGKLKCSFG